MRRRQSGEEAQTRPNLFSKILQEETQSQPFYFEGDAGDEAQSTFEHVFQKFHKVEKVCE